MQLLHTLTTYPPAIGGAQLHQHLIAQQLKQKHQLIPPLKHQLTHLQTLKRQPIPPLKHQL